SDRSGPWARGRGSVPLPALPQRRALLAGDRRGRLAGRFVTKGSSGPPVHHHLGPETLRRAQDAPIDEGLRRGEDGRFPSEIARVPSRSFSEAQKPASANEP